MTENAMVRASDINVDDIGRIGKMLAMSGYFDSANNFEVAVAQMATKVMAGREMGFGPFASANGIHIIKGKPGVGANLMASAVKSHPRYNYRVREMTAQACRIEFFERADSGEWESIGVSEFTEADARAAGTQNMQKYARNMLFARAMSNGVRWFCPDVFNGNAVYVPEELGATVDDDGNMVEAKYTVHQPQPAQMQNGNGTAAANMPERMSVAEYNAHNLLHDDPDVDFSDIPEDSAGAMATPASGGGYDYATMYNDPDVTFSEGTAKFIGHVRKLHTDSSKPMTAKQYGYMCSLIDNVAGKDMHGCVLSATLGYTVSSDNIPGMGAKGIIDWLKNDENKFDDLQAKAKAAIGEIAAKCREAA